MNHKTLGLDIGIASVGWGVIDQHCRIVAAGVRLFEESDAQNNLKRQTYRGMRRIKRRRAERIRALRSLLENEGMITKGFKPLPNPYVLRQKGLCEKPTYQHVINFFTKCQKKSTSKRAMNSAGSAFL